jgi:hypothetical protein
MWVRVMANVKWVLLVQSIFIFLSLFVSAVGRGKFYDRTALVLRVSFRGDAGGISTARVWAM